jgi:ATP-dependent helicase HrpA
VQRALSNESKLALGRSRHESVAELLADCTHGAVDHLVASAGGPAWDGVGFDALQARVRSELTDTAVAVTTFAGRIVETADRLERRLAAMTSPALREAVTDMTQQLDALVHPGFVAESGADRLPDVLRYLRGIEHRLDRIGEDPVRDRERTRAVRGLMDRYERVRRTSARGEDIRWLIEELRISLFAQPLRTRHPVSAKRIVRELERAGGSTTGA